jgi:hypothetical protein
MAADGERASRREFITAVVAIVVGGLVGLAGVVVGCQSSRDSQRTAREAQRESARAQRAQADTGASWAVSDSSTGGDGVYRKRRSTELRSLLDRAGVDLAEFEDAAGKATRGQARGSGLDSVVRAAYSSLARLEIRLGERADVVKFFHRAILRFSLASLPRSRASADGGSDWRVIAHLSGGGFARQFTAEARKLVGSQLPSDPLGKLGAS